MTIYETVQEWAKARDFILPAMAYHHTHTEDDIIARLCNGEYKLWRTEKCALVTRFIQYPQLKAIEVIWGGGDLEELKAMRTQVENFGRMNGCKESVGSGRNGWAKALPDYTQIGALFFKEL